MYNTLNILLMITGLAIPFVCLCRNLRQKLWPVMVSLACGCSFLVLQIVVLSLRVKWAGAYGLPQLTGDILRLSALFLSGLLVTTGCYACSAFYCGDENGEVFAGAGSGLRVIRRGRGKGRYILGLSLAGLIAAIALTTPVVYYVNSTETAYAYLLGEKQPRGTHQISIQGVYVKRMLKNGYFDGWWSVEGYTDGMEHITAYSPDDRPYKSVTRYDSNGEKITGSYFGIFGNDRFTEYVIQIDYLITGNENTDWPPEKGNVLCTDAEDYHALLAVAERNNIGGFDIYYLEQGEVVP